jgi:hypothetical protein
VVCFADVWWAIEGEPSRCSQCGELDPKQTDAALCHEVIVVAYLA